MEQALDHALARLKANELTALDLNDKNLTEAQVTRLAKVLKHNQSLTTLNLYNNQLSAAGAEKLSEALKVNRTLVSLNLNSNQLGATGAEKLSEALKVNRTLTTLNLYDNQLGATGAEKLSEALKVNQSLATLNLGYNQLDNATVQGIEDTLQTNINRIKSTRNQTLLTLVILLRHAHSPASTLPKELWEIIMQQLDFPSVSKGYRTSHAIASFLTQKNTLTEFNQRLQTQQSVRLKETHGVKRNESRFSFLTSQTILLSNAANTLSSASHEEAETQIAEFNNKC